MCGSVGRLRGAATYAAVLLMFLHPSTALLSEKKLTLDAGGCQGVEWKRLVRVWG